MFSFMKNNIHAGNISQNKILVDVFSMIVVVTIVEIVILIVIIYIYVCSNQTEMMIIVPALVRAIAYSNRNTSSNSNGTIL